MAGIEGKNPKRAAARGQQASPIRFVVQSSSLFENLKEKAGRFLPRLPSANHIRVAGAGNQEKTGCCLIHGVSSVKPEPTKIMLQYKFNQNLTVLLQLF